MRSEILSNYEKAVRYVNSKYLFPFVKELFTSRDFHRKFSRDGFIDLTGIGIRIPGIPFDNPMNVYRCICDRRSGVVLRSCYHLNLTYRYVVDPHDCLIYDKLDIVDYWRLFNYYIENRK